MRSANYIRDQFRGHRDMLDEFSMGMDEVAHLIMPPRAGVVENEVEVWGVFIPSETVDDTITVHGILSRLNGRFFMREAFIPDLVEPLVREGTFDPKPGFRFRVRGVTMRVTRMVLDEGELAIMLSDLIQES